MKLHCEKCGREVHETLHWANPTKDRPYDHKVDYYCTHVWGGTKSKKNMVSVENKRRIVDVLCVECYNQKKSKIK